MAKNLAKSNLGKNLELIVESANKQYQLMGRALITKNEVKTQEINGRMKYIEKADPDFSGCLAGGRHIAFDCKNTQAASFPLRSIDQRPHQLRHLETVHKMGGVAFYLVCMERYNRFFVLPIPQVQAAIKRANEGGRKSIPLEEMTLEAKGGFSVALDYLSALPPVTR